MVAEIFIGTSGWHYNDWTRTFYPPEITGYHELTYHARFFNTVENNSSFYRVASEPTYKTWSKMTRGGYKFSIKLNKQITHTNKLRISDDVREKVDYILDTTQVLENKIGALLIQLPASFKFDLERLKLFLAFFTKKVRSHPFAFDLAIEFRNRYWFTEETYALLRKYNVALVAADSSRYPSVREVTANVAYIRMHGPTKLFASSYSDEQLKDLAEYIQTISPGVNRIYVYFNNDFHGYAIKNAQRLQYFLGPG
ncbi:MAG TPA: DUF72 domain-containing protein [Candidatus Saccharimonadales bacterium]|nr:DUF72 domain-containing protein [Candidatus Saccharimonadales bacterium]